MNPSEVYTHVRNQCAESSEEFWTEDEIYSLISMGEHIIAQKLGVIEMASYFTTASGTKLYSLASNISNTVCEIRRVEYDSYHLEGININDLDEVEGTAYGGVTVQGSPTSYYRYGNSIGFSPTPDTAKKVDIYFTTVPRPVTGTSSVFTIPDEYTGSIINYALYRMFLKDSELSKEASAYKAEWNEDLNRITIAWSDKKNRDQYPEVRINTSLVEE